MGFDGELYNTKQFGENKEDMYGQPGEYIADISYDLFELLYRLHEEWDISSCDVEFEITKEDVYMVIDNLYALIINSKSIKPDHNSIRDINRMEDYFKTYTEAKKLLYVYLKEQNDKLILKANW